MPIIRHRINGTIKIIPTADWAWHFTNPISGSPIANDWGVIIGDNLIQTSYGVETNNHISMTSSLISILNSTATNPSHLALTNAQAISLYQQYHNSVTGVDDNLPFGNNLTNNNKSYKIKSEKSVPGSKVTTVYGEIIERSEAVNTPHGYAKKDDKRLIMDFVSKLLIIYDPMKYGEGAYAKIGTDIDNKGKFTDFKITIHHPSHAAHIAVGRTIYGDYFDPLLTLKNKFKMFYEEDLNSGYFCLKGSTTPFVKGKKVAYRKVNCKSGSFEKSITNKPLTYKGTFGKKYSFGVEIETCSGNIPPYLDSFIFYSAVHDGSLRHEDDGKVYGGEYVTDVLAGDLGLSNLKLLCNELSKRCLVDKTCGVHVHIGDAIFDKETVVLMYYLYTKLQDEIFSMLPISRRKNEYCRKLTDLNIIPANILSEREYSIDSYYNQVISLLAQSNLGNKVNKKFDHPKGPKCNYDHSTARYCWVNFMPTVFNTRKNGIYTIEFRPAPGSTSYIKIKNWLMVCFALVDIVENHKAAIYSNPNITLYEILDICYPQNGKMLIEWVEKRKQKFSVSSSKIEHEEYLDNEIDEDLSLKKV